MAMGITLAENRLDLEGDRLYIEDRGIEIGEIAWGPRIGIRVGTESPWRAWVRGHHAVSGVTLPTKATKATKITQATKKT